MLHLCSKTPKGSQLLPELVWTPCTLSQHPRPSHIWFRPIFGDSFAWFPPHVACASAAPEGSWVPELALPPVSLGASELTPYLEVSFSLQGPPSSPPVYPHATSPSCFLDSPTPTPQPRLLPLPPSSYPAFGYNFISCPLADHLLRDSWQHASSEVAGTECLAHFRRFFFFLKDLLDKIFAVDKFSYPKLA